MDDLIENKKKSNSKLLPALDKYRNEGSSHISGKKNDNKMSKNSSYETLFKQKGLGHQSVHMRQSQDSLLSKFGNLSMYRNEKKFPMLR